MTWKYVLSLLTLIAINVWLAVFTYPEPKLHLIACDVGQGDAILATYGRVQILVDGGPNNQVLDCLSSFMPFWDRQIEVVVLTHPQHDHLKGLIEVFNRYQVVNLITSGLDSSSQQYKALKNAVGGSDAKVVNATSGMVIRLGKIYLDIVHPSEEFIAINSEIIDSKNGEAVLGAYTSSRDPNEFSVVAILSYKDFDALLTGDISPRISDTIAEELALSDSRTIEYIKIPHHGSKNGLTKDLLEVTKPEVSVISAGKDNQYGHPHQEVLEILGERDIRILRTDEMGNIEVVSDGKKWWVE